MTLPQVFRFLKRYALNHPLYVVVYGVTYFLPGFSFKEHILTQKEVTEAIEKGTSIIRFGDGEINLMLTLKNHYHSFSPRLKKMMEEIVEGYTKEARYILGVPRFIKVRNLDLKKIGKFNVWLPLKVMFFLKFPKKIPYMDAHSFYYDRYFEEVVAPSLIDKTVVCLTKKETIEFIKKNPNFGLRNIVFLETPSQDVLPVYESIVENLNHILSSLEKSKVVLLVAMGPVGKYLIFEYSKKGYQGIDIGVAIETIFTGVSLEERI